MLLCHHWPWRTWPPIPPRLARLLPLPLPSAAVRSEEGPELRKRPGKQKRPRKNYACDSWLPPGVQTFSATDIKYLTLRCLRQSPPTARSSSYITFLAGEIFRHPSHKVAQNRCYAARFRLRYSSNAPRNRSDRKS